MEISLREIAPHPQLLEALFACRSKVSAVFNDVLGIHGISHIAISQVCSNHKILTFSSTPAMEFNLFSSNLWRYDKSYHPEWFGKCTHATWQSLYLQPRYDELYYLKQIKHHFPIGYSFAKKWDNKYFILSIASNNSCS